jgi:hypothetical protein
VVRRQREEPGTVFAPAPVTVTNGLEHAIFLYFYAD